MGRQQRAEGKLGEVCSGAGAGPPGPGPPGPTGPGPAGAPQGGSSGGALEGLSPLIRDSAPATNL